MAAAAAVARRHSPEHQKTKFSTVYTRGKHSNPLIQILYDENDEHPLVVGETIHDYQKTGTASDNGWAKQWISLRKAVRCEINNLVKFQKTKEDYINTKQRFTIGSNPQSRKAKWEGCSEDFQSAVSTTDFNSNNAIDKTTLAHFKRHGFKLPNNIVGYDIAVFMSDDEPQPTPEEILKKLKEEMQPQRRDTVGGRRHKRTRRKKSRKRKSRRKKKSKRKKRKTKRKTKRRRKRRR